MSSVSLKLNPLKVTFTLLIAGLLALASCQKEKNLITDEAVLPVSARCEAQTANPDGRFYSGASFAATTYDKSNCGLIPLSTKNYWVYQDSVYINGTYSKTQYDTLRFTPYKTLTDELIWWKGNISVGLPAIMYANDSTLFALENRIFGDIGERDASREFSLYNSDTTFYLANFEDMAAMGRSIKLQTSLTTAAGTFNGCVYFDKNARSYRRDQLIIKPGVGVVKYIYEEAPMGQPLLKMQKIMTLVAMHIE